MLVAFLRGRPGPPCIPCSIAQDAAGPSTEPGCARHGGFGMAIAFLPAEMLEGIHSWHESLGHAANRATEEQPLTITGSHGRLVVRNVLPLELFEIRVPWFSVLAKRWKFPDPHQCRRASAGGFDVVQFTWPCAGHQASRSC